MLIPCQRNYDDKPKKDWSIVDQFILLPRDGGVGVPGMTVICTMPLSLKPFPSVTVNLNNIIVSVARFGAVNLALEVLASLIITEGPPVCVHANVIGFPSGS
jgi:hypothetical protein